MASLKSLAKDTAIYGLSSIVGRFLNYLLVPVYTAKMSAASGGYGIVTNVYAYTALLMVILTYGMETTFFRFANKEGENARRVYGTILTMVGCTSLIFVATVLIFLNPISSIMGYAGHTEYIWTMALVIAMDAFQCIPFSYLRYKKRPIKFACLKLLFIILSITLTIFFFVVYPQFSGTATPVSYVFYINLGCTSFIMLCFYKELTVVRPILDRQLMRRMLSYSWPILILGVAGILNQTADKILFPHIYTESDAHMQLGIYGAASKIAMIMAMITQAFRYAYEPFVFGKSREQDNRDTYARAMKFFIIFTLLAFLCVSGYINIIRYIIGRDYWDGLRVVPIVMAAEIMMGIYFNLSFWYKLIDKTIWGAWFSGAGCAVLIVINIIFVPCYGYMACAWAGVAGYATAMLLSYFVGQKFYPIAYPLRSILVYVATTAVLYIVINKANNSTLPLWASLSINTVAIIAFAAMIAKKEKVITNKKL